MKLKDCIPLFFAAAASLGGCGTSEPGPAGPAGQPGPVDPKLTSLIPSGAFLSRTLDMQISGSGTHFTAGTTVDFGDAQITTSEIAVGSDNNLRLTVQVGMGTRLGSHDVTVTSGSESALLKGAFMIKTALQAEPVSQQPMIAQGGLYPYSLRNLDYRENPLGGSTPLLSGFSTAGSIGGGATRLEGVALIDAFTPPGLLSISAVAKSPFGADVYYSTAPTDSNLAMAVASTPSPLTNNTARVGESLSAQYADKFYKLTTGAASQLLIVTYSALGTKLVTGIPSLVTALAPASGKFSQGLSTPWTFDMTAQIGIALMELATAGDYYLATYTDDFSGAPTGYTYTITPKVSTLTSMNNVEPTAETPANPSLKVNSLTGAVAASAGKLTTSTDSDYLVFTAATTGDVLFQIANNYSASNYPYPVTVQLYSDATCTTTLGSSQSISPGKSLTQQIAVTAGVTYCAELAISFATPAEVPYKIILVP